MLDLFGRINAEIREDKSTTDGYKPSIPKEENYELLRLTTLKPSKNAVWRSKRVPKNNHHEGYSVVIIFSTKKKAMVQMGGSGQTPPV